LLFLVPLAIASVLIIVSQNALPYVQGDKTGLLNLPRYLFLVIWFTIFKVWVTSGSILTPEEESLINKEMAASDSFPSATSWKLAIKRERRNIQNEFLTLVWSIGLLLPAAFPKYFRISESDYSGIKWVVVIWVLLFTYLAVSTMRAIYSHYSALRSHKINLLVANAAERLQQREKPKD